MNFSSVIQHLTGGRPVVGRIRDGIGRDGGVGGRPDARLTDIIGVGQQIACKPRLTPQGQIRPVAGPPDLSHIGVEQRVDAVRRLRRQTAGRNANQAADLTKGLAVGGGSQDALPPSQPPVRPWRAGLTLGR